MISMGSSRIFFTRNAAEEITRLTAPETAELHGSLEAIFADQSTPATTDYAMDRAPGKTSTISTPSGAQALIMLPEGLESPGRTIWVLAVRATSRDTVAARIEASLLSSPWDRYAARPFRVRAAQAASSIAVRIAGVHREHLQEDWEAVLAGSPEDGFYFSESKKLLLSLTFLKAALQMRAHDLSRPLWTPIDWVIQTDFRTQTSIAILVGAQATYIVGDGGLSALATDVWEPCGIAGGSLYLLVRWLRRLRGIELNASPPRAEDE